MASAPSGNVRRLLDLSTGHLPRADRDRLERVRETDNASPPASCLAGPYGWLFSVATDLVPELWGHSAALPAILARARALGCDYVLLDSDGPVDEVLPFVARQSG
ncbi:hypothetical protein HLH33_16700 [Gluconacetobacter diazotrophicus]|uniref:DUF5983 domain-containing protein n=1 Tax=Gluconacetobacter diazotrophicus TaxID=33996 RepID=A0A7W4NP43_GLUDI|nr:hypothetical protein [Gluconacetobacter diazotrophicus]